MKLLKISLVFGALLALVASAAEVSPEDAARAVGAWHGRRGNRFGGELRGKVHSSRRVQQGKAKFNVVRFSEGGFVITSADTQRRPVVFIGEGDDYDEGATNHPLYAILQRDLGGVRVGRGRGEAVTEATEADATERVPPGETATEAGGGGTTPLPEAGAEESWAKLLETPVAPVDNGIADAPMDYDTAPVSVSDIRVGPLLSTYWGQSNGIFNYYTPKSYVCGCVATALAQIMRYFEWPDSSFTVPQYTSQYTAVDDVTTPYTMKGGTYDWSHMPNGYSGYSTTQKQAVGKLCYDCGVAVSMDWASDGSGTATMLQQTALVHRFNYSNCVVGFKMDDSSYTGQEADFRRAIIANFDNGRPVGIAVPGHAIVFDGYAFTSGGDLTYHVNFGWYGSDNGWYIPPNMESYSAIDCMNYNIFTTEPAGSSIISGRVLGLNGRPASSVAVKLCQITGNQSSEIASTTSNTKGIWSFVAPPNKTYIVRAEVPGVSEGATPMINLAANVSVRLVGTDGKRSYYVSPTPAFGNSSENDIQLQASRGWPPFTEMTNLEGATVPVSDVWSGIFGDGGGISNGVVNADLVGQWTMNGVTFTVGDGGRLVTTEKTTRDGEIDLCDGATLIIDGGEVVDNNHHGTHGIYVGDTGTASGLDYSGRLVIRNGGKLTSTYQFMRVGYNGGNTGILTIDNGTLALPTDHRLIFSGTGGSTAIVGITNANVTAYAIKFNEGYTRGMVKSSIKDSVLNLTYVHNTSIPLDGSYMKYDGVTFYTAKNMESSAFLGNIGIPYTLDGNGITVNVTNSNIRAEGTYEGTGPFIKAGPKPMVFKNAQFNSSGTLDVREGTLTLASDSTIGSSARVSVASGATLAVAENSADNRLPSAFGVVTVAGVLDLGGTEQTVSARAFDGSDGIFRDGAELRNGKLTLDIPSNSGSTTYEWCRFTDMTLTIGPGGHLYLPARSDRRGEINFNGTNLKIDGGIFEDLNSRQGAYIGNSKDAKVEISNGGKFIYKKGYVALGYSSDADAKKGTLICKDGTVDLGDKNLLLTYSNRSGSALLAMTNSVLNCGELRYGNTDGYTAGVQTLSLKDTEVTFKNFVKHAVHADSSATFNGATFNTTVDDRDVLTNLVFAYQLDGAGATLNVTNTGISASGSFAGTGPLVKTGSRRLEFGGAWNSSGAIEVREGSMAFASSASLANGTVIRATDGTTLEVAFANGAFVTAGATLQLDSQTGGKVCLAINGQENVPHDTAYAVFGGLDAAALARLTLPDGVSASLDANGVMSITVSGTHRWTGGAASAIWSLPANWDTSVVLSAGDTAIFAGVGGPTTYDRSSVALGSVRIDSGFWTNDLDHAALNTGAMTVASDSGLALVNPAAENPLPQTGVAISGTLDLGGATQTFSSDPDDIFLNGGTVMNGVYNLTNEGDWNTRDYTFTIGSGAVVNLAGILRPASGNGIGDMTINVVDGGVLNLNSKSENQFCRYKNNWTSVYVDNGSRLTAGTVRLGWDTNGRGRFYVRNGSSAVFSGTMKLSGKSEGKEPGSADIQVLDGSLLQVDGGIGYGYCEWKDDPVELTVSGGSTLKTSAISGGTTGSHNVSFNFTNAVFETTTAGVNLFDDSRSRNAVTFHITGGTLTVSNAAGRVTIGSVVDGAGGLALTGGGELEFTASPVYTGMTTVMNGTLTLGTGISLGGGLEVQSGATANLVPGATFGGVVALNGNVAFTGLDLNASHFSPVKLLTAQGTITMTGLDQHRDGTSNRFFVRSTNAGNVLYYGMKLGTTILIH